MPIELPHQYTAGTMSIQDYLSSYRDDQAITLVGPLNTLETLFKDPVIFVDGGSKFRENTEGYSVGDGDSYTGQLDHQLNPEKDFSDLAYVLRHLPENFSEIQLRGFLGGRRDHELFNLGEAHQLLKVREQPTQLSLDQSVLAFSQGQWKLDISGLFSIAVIQTTLINLTGDCLYQCPKETSFNPLSSHGLSNEGFGTIYLNCNGPVFVFLDSEQKQHVEVSAT